ncbi:MAG: site-specific integrase [Desulfobacterales bacterium]|nr:site-specific integrase [Desulfobacterales bacterium]
MFIAGLGKKNKRIVNLLIPMRNVFKLALKAEYIEKNPMDLLDPIKVEKPDINPFTYDEAQAIIKHIDPFYRNFATVMFFTGMRFSEAAALKHCNVDFRLSVIKVREALVEGEFDRPKTKGSMRDIKMLPMVENALRDQRKATWGKTDFVFLNMAERNLKPTPFNQKIWKKACSLAGIKYKPVKHTRSTFITMMLDAGEHVGWVARQVGHSSFKMIYDHYYSYITNYQSDDGAKFMGRVYERAQKKPRENESRDNSVTLPEAISANS